MGQRIGAYRVLLGKPEGKRQLGRPRRRWENDINGSSGSGIGALAGLNWLRVGTGGRLLKMQ
jgi:hypothetical protein